MQGQEIFTPASEITAARKKAVPKAVPQGRAPARTGVAQDEDKTKKAAQVHFKASHGLIVAFFTFIL